MTVVERDPLRFKTETLAAPGCASRLAGTAAVNCVGLPNVVVSESPFHCTVAPVTKFAPVTLSVNPAAPAVAEAGLSLSIPGAAGPEQALKLTRLKAVDVSANRGTEVALFGATLRFTVMAPELTTSALKLT